MMSSAASNPYLTDTFEYQRTINDDSTLLDSFYPSRVYVFDCTISMACIDRSKAKDGDTSSYNWLAGRAYMVAITVPRWLTSAIGTLKALILVHNMLRTVERARLQVSPLTSQSNSAV
jgi:hypothetical protein